MHTLCVQPRECVLTDAPRCWHHHHCGTLSRRQDDVCGLPGLNGTASCQQALFPTEPPMSVHQQFSCACAGTSAEVCNILGAGLDGSLRIIIDVDHEEKTASLARA